MHLDLETFYSRLDQRLTDLILKSTSYVREVFTIAIGIVACFLYFQPNQILEK